MRLGPNKIGFIGILQPFSDALKLFRKNLIPITKINYIFWNSSPLITIFLFLIVIDFFPIKNENNTIKINILIIILILTLFIFPIFWGRFFSFRKFSIIRSKRLIRQIISYEIGLIIILILIIPIFFKTNLFLIIINSNIFIYTGNFIILVFFIIILRESRRIPFDFIEGESELVSGFNTEFLSTYFSLFFIYEYGIIIFFRILISIIFINFFLSFFLIFLFIIIRSCFPRIRYDQIMIFMWKLLYPIIISLILVLKLV